MEHKPGGAAFPCLAGCGTLLPARGRCEACADRYVAHVAAIATLPQSPCDQCGRAHLPHTECVSWTEFCSMRDTLRAQLAGVREKAEHLLSFVLIGEDSRYRPDSMSFVTPLEFHQHTTHAMRELLAALVETPR